MLLSNLRKNSIYQVNLNIQSVNRKIVTYDSLHTAMDYVIIVIRTSGVKENFFVPLANLSTQCRKWLFYEIIFVKINAFTNVLTRSFCDWRLWRHTFINSFSVSMVWIWKKKYFYLIIWCLFLLRLKDDDFSMFYTCYSYCLFWRYFNSRCL